MALRKTLVAAALLVATLVVAACDSSEERAEKYFQSGMSYLAAGDVDRALVEFRNVFKLNGRHHDARLTYANVERERGNLREAFGQYLRLIEQYPNDFDGQLALAQMSAASGAWDEAQGYANAALGIRPDDLEAQTVQVIIDYGRAATRTDDVALAAAARAAKEMLGRKPDDIVLHAIHVDSLVRAQKYEEAVAAADEALTHDPDDRTIYSMRLAALAALGNDPAVEAGLRQFVDRFPDDRAISDSLVRWFVSRKEIDKAEEFLRSRSGQAGEDTTRELELVRFLAEYRGPDAAIAELDRIIASGKSTPVFRSARAGMLFDRGDRAAAVAEMEDILKTATPSDETRNIKVGLARMLVAMGNNVGGRALVEQVLAEDAGHVEAMKLKATWLILSDQVGEAITILRRALDQSPRDPDIMTLMAQAYERDGNRDLMREMLSLAVEASGRAPAESLRYAQLLAGEDKLLAAEGVLIDALRMAPGTPGLLTPLAQIYVELRDWPRAETVAGELEALGTPGSIDAAAAVRTAILQGQQKSDEALDYLRGLVEAGQGGLAPKIGIIRAHLANGDNQKALAYAEELLAATPDDPSLRFVVASVRALTGDNAGAEDLYRALVAEDQTRVQVWMALFRLIAEDDTRLDEARTLLDQALAALPDEAELKWAKAGILERQGDFEGAIQIYEAMYAQNSSNQIVANNLASLLSNHRTDPESLDRAELIARRLRDSNVAPFQDTYGWIAYQRGNYELARSELEKAASVLTEDPSVQYHLAMTYLALGDKQKAADTLRRTVDLLAKGGVQPFADSARAELDKLVAEGFAAGN